MSSSLKLPLHQHLIPHLFKADEFEADFKLIYLFLLILITALRHIFLKASRPFFEVSPKVFNAS